MKLEPDLLWIPVQDLFDEWMIRTATRALIIPEFHQRDLGVFRPAEVAAAFNVSSKWRGIRLRRSIGLAAQKHCSAGCNGNCQNNNDDRLHGFPHAPHTSAAHALRSKVF